MTNFCTTVDKPHEFKHMQGKHTAKLISSPFSLFCFETDSAMYPWLASKLSILLPQLPEDYRCASPCPAPNHLKICFMVSQWSNMIEDWRSVISQGNIKCSSAVLLCNNSALWCHNSVWCHNGIFCNVTIHHCRGITQHCGAIILWWWHEGAMCWLSGELWCQNSALW